MKSKMLGHIQSSLEKCEPNGKNGKPKGMPDRSGVSIRVGRRNVDLVTQATTKQFLRWMEGVVKEQGDYEMPWVPFKDVSKEEYGILVRFAAVLGGLRNGKAILHDSTAFVKFTDWAAQKGMRA